MKHLSRILMLSLFLLSATFASAQTANNPWAVGLETNAVDFFPVGATAPQGELFDNFFNVTDHWNIYPGPSKISVARYIGSGFAAKVEGSFNKIKKYGDVSGEVHGLKTTYYKAGGGLTYSIGHLIYGEQGGWFDPYIDAGVNSTWINDKAEFLGNVGLGFNFWLNDHIAFTLSSVYNGAFNHHFDTYNHFQHSAGIKIAMGGKDSDGDGIYDKYDECPDEPGLPEFNGCPDSDGDGIPDHLDECPNEPGLPEFNGCPDTDGDGVPDHLDECPTEAGPAELNGCPDSDGDGVADKDDECPNEPGLPELNGCPDRDGDGVPDKDDQCPDVPGPASNNGCPEEPDAPVIKQLNDYSKLIEFDLGKSTIRESSHSTLESIAQVMKEYPTAEFHLAGFTDSTGGAAINEKLSNERANAVRDYLVNKLGIESNRLTAKGYGPKNPVATNSTAEGRQKNRRVEIMLQKERQNLEQNM